MSNVFSKGRLVLFGLFLVLALLGGAGWVYRAEVLCWYNLRGLAAATKDNRDDWIRRLAAMDSAVALPGLLNQLSSANPQTCANAEAALSFLAAQWGADDARTMDLARQLVEQFPGFGAPGQEAVLEWQLAQLKISPAPPKELAESAGRLLRSALQSAEKGVRQRTLALANVLLEFAPTASLESCKELARRELKAPEAECRLQVLHLILHPELQKETALVKLAIPLLKDKEPAVRRAAVLAVGLARAVIAEDDLLPLLNDADKEVRRLGEMALRQRGLSKSQIVLGSLINDPRPQVRMKILEELPDISDLDPGPWLLRLSQDPAEAVRAGAIRAMAAYPIAALRKRLQQMAQDDPSPTVRQNAGYYLKMED